MDKSFHIITFGCQMNKNDTERLIGMLENIGMHEVPEWKNADLVILNTCSVRDKAERRVLGQFNAINHYRKENKLQMELAITGCMPQHMKKFVLEKLPFLDYIIGVNNMELLPGLIGKKISLEEQIGLLRLSRTEEGIANYEKELSLQKRTEGSRAWVSIMFGCDKFCSYCIVPYTRGREHSRRKEDIFQELGSLKDKGYSEVVLLGQNVNSYGKRLYDDYFFPDLLEDIAVNYPWLKKIDFLTSHPQDVSPRLALVMAAHSNINKEIHFPLQHGDNQILEKMNRGYTVEEYKDIVKMLRDKIPGIRIGTDLIAGFPGETEEQFNRMLEAVKEIKFDFANTAAYSTRPGTKASRMEGQLPEEIRKKRLNILNDLLEKIKDNKG